MSVRVFGAVLSSMFYENSNGSGDTEGLLLGRINSHVTDTISDTQISNVKEETFICVYAYIRCDVALSWYDNCGRLDKTKLQSILPSDARKDVIGWYKFRRNSQLSVSMRERAVHKHLRREFLNRHDDHFLFLLCGSDEMPNQATLSYNHVFHTFGPVGIQSLSTEILNLGDTSHNEYKSAKTAQYNSDTDMFAQTLSSLRKEFHTTTGEMRSVASLQKLKTTAQQQLQETCRRVARSEDVLGTLRAEIKAMRQSLAVKYSATEVEPIETSTPGKPPPQSVRPTQTQSDVSMDISSRRQRLPAASTKNSRRMSSLSDVESSTCQFDLEDAHSHSTTVVENPANVSAASGPTKTVDLISFDEESDNIENQARDNACGFADSFVSLNLNQRDSTSAEQTTLPPVLTPQPAFSPKTRKQVADEADVSNVSDKSCDDPFSGLADVQRKRVLHKNRKPKPKHSDSNVDSVVQQNNEHTSHTPTRSTRSQVQGHTKSERGQVKVNVVQTSPDRPIVLESDDKDSSDS